MKNGLNSIEKAILISLPILYPFHPGELAGIDSINFSLGDPIVFISILLLIIGLVGSYRVPKYMWIVLLFISIALISLIIPYNYHHTDIHMGLFEVIKLVGAVMWSLIIYNLIQKDPVQGIWVFSMLSVAISTIFSITTIYSGFTGATLRPSGPFVNPNLYGNFLVMNFFLSFILQHIIRKKHGNPYTIMIFPIVWATLFIAVVYTGSRGALAGFVSGLLLLAILMIMNKSQLQNINASSYSYFLLIFISVLGLIWIIWQTNPFVADRIIATFQGDGRNIDTRIEQYLFGIIVFIENPIFGAGYHQAESYVQANYGLRITSIHNTYIAVAAGTGAIGLCCFFAFLIHILRSLVRLYIYQGRIALFLLCAIIAMLIQSLFTNGENFRSLWILIGMSAALYQYYFHTV